MPADPKTTDEAPWWRRAARMAMVILTAVGGTSFAHSMHWPQPAGVICGLVFLCIFWMAAGWRVE